MALKKGDFVLVDFVAKVKETTEVFDTTLEETAKKDHLYKEGDLYEPKLIVVGEGWLIKALDESLTEMKIGKPAVVEITPEKGFGQRDPEKVKRVPLKQLLSKEITPRLGMRIEYGGKMATVRAMGAGRVLLDFNPPLAGKTLIYEITVKKKLKDVEGKIRALIHRRVPAVEIDKFQFSISGKTVSVDIPEEAFYVEGIQLAKRGVAMDIQRFFGEMRTVRFTETHEVEPKEPEAQTSVETKKKKKRKTPRKAKKRKRTKKRRSGE